MRVRLALVPTTSALCTAICNMLTLVLTNPKYVSTRQTRANMVQKAEGALAQKNQQLADMLLISTFFVCQGLCFWCRWWRVHLGSSNSSSGNLHCESWSCSKSGGPAQGMLLFDATKRPYCAVLRCAMPRYVSCAVPCHAVP